MSLFGRLAVKKEGDDNNIEAIKLSYYINHKTNKIKTEAYYCT